jgi:hypothetical protein
VSGEQRTVVSVVQRKDPRIYPQFGRGSIDEAGQKTANSETIADYNIDPQRWALSPDVVIISRRKAVEKSGSAAKIFVP